MKKDLYNLPFLWPIEDVITTRSYLMIPMIILSNDFQTTNPFNARS